ncbi:Hypothetical protein R9X50_00785300 [Acrodontium crateriforme]|uniref:Uncharacterized protein n=1 Tax=Acrodontium crateriforme TaxID=150365 RepID=A0AAQ3R829_9PEZI|nr:Hypothetical protein R9X50_00785300 [Acrodontium crateriforme]
MYQHIAGCYWIPSNANWKREYLPQVQLESQTTLTPVSFITKLTQTFHNANSSSIPQVRYTFPLYDGVAVNGYVISYADKRLTGVVKQKDVAKQTYQAAVDRGEAAALLESLPAGIFGVTLGNVPAQIDIVVEITYCGELKHDAAIDGLRYTLPTSIAPRYGDYPGTVMKSNVAAKSGIKITVDADMVGSPIRKLMSPSHPISVSMGATSKTEHSGATFVPSQASAELSQGTAELGSDFVIQLLFDDISRPQAILENHPTIPNQRAIMTTLVPKFVLPSEHPEIVFIADQSGSMGGSKNTALVAALQVFLKSLPLGVRFNICAFGNSYQFLWPKSQAYNEANLASATRFVSNFTASYGGTEILEPIKETFKSRLSDLPLEVMLLTDGEVWQESAIFDFINSEIHEKKTEARVFTLGIGNDVSHTLVEGVARAGNGFAQFVTSNEETDQKVIRMLKAALYGHMKDYAIEVHYAASKIDSMTEDDDFEMVEKVNDCLHIKDKAQESNAASAEKQPISFFDPSAAPADTPSKVDATVDRYAHLPSVETPKLLQAPSSIPPLFPFNRTTVYLLLGPETEQRPVSSITLRAKCSAGPLELNIPVHEKETTAIPAIHQLAARKAIQELEENRGWLHTVTGNDDKGETVLVKKKYESRFDELVEREVVKLGEKYQVASKWTSFVAVEDKTQDEDREQECTSIEQSDTELHREQPYQPVKKSKKRLLMSRTAQSGGTASPMASLRRCHSPPDARFHGGPTNASPQLMMQRQQPMQSQPPMPISAYGSPPSTMMRSMQVCISPPPPAFWTQAASDGPSFSPQDKECEDGDDDMGFGVFDGTEAAASQQTTFGCTSSGLASMAAAPGGALFGIAGSAAPPATTSDKSTTSQAPHKQPFFGAAKKGAPSTGSVFSRKQADVVASKPANISASSSETKCQVLRAIIAKQSFSGAWALDTKLLELLGVTMSPKDVVKAMKSSLPGLKKLSEESIATALVIAGMEMKLKAQKDVWEMVDEKARTWLGGQLSSVEVSDLINAAAQHI